jgi:anti-anti-sigma factor
MEAIIEAFSEHPEVIAIDLSAVSFMDVAALRALVDGARHIEEARGRFVVIRPADRQVARLFELAGAYRALDIHESVDSALRPWLHGTAGETPTGA